MTTHLTMEQRQLARRLSAKGLSLREIGRQVGCSHEVIRTVVRRESKYPSRPDSWQPAVIAEGVETLEQATALKDLKCSFAQGYLYSRPAPATDVDPDVQGRPGVQIRHTDGLALPQDDDNDRPYTAREPARRFLQRALSMPVSSPSVGGPIRLRFLDFAEHRREDEVARFIEAPDDVLHDVYRGARQREVG